MQRISGFGDRAYPYKVTVPPGNGAVNLETLKSHLRITNCKQDDILQLYLDAAIEFAEECTGLDLITRTYQTERDFFPNISNEGYYTLGIIPETFGDLSNGNVGFQLRRGPVQAVSLVEYIESGTTSTFITVDPSTYYVTIPEAGKFTDILLAIGKLWPTNASSRQNSIRITFTSGFGNAPKDIPSDLRTAILEHATNLFSNRGDCCTTTSLPAMSKAIYAKHRVINL